MAPVGVEGGVASPELLSLVRGMLAKKPQQRLRVHDLRRNAWVTSNGTAPLPAPAHAMGGAGGRQATFVGELLHEAVVRHRTSRRLSTASRNSTRHASTETGGGGAAPAAAAPPPKPAAPKPKTRPSMLKRG